MQKTEVTQGEWKSVMRTNPAEFKNCGEDCPVEMVSWNDAVAYANARSRHDGLPECYVDSSLKGLGCTGYRLPTEAEWEYAARAGTTEATYGGNLSRLGALNTPAVSPIAWYGGNSGVSYEGAVDCSRWFEKQFPSATCGPHPVRQRRANAWGLYDMLGNVSEWTGDLYGEYPSSASDPTGAAAGDNRVDRGGSWHDYAFFARAASRSFGDPAGSFNFLGFRLARTAP
jgi:formylglycine-generating enzyme required for sulfatase activity